MTDSFEAETVVDPASLARIRVYTRAGGGQKMPMLGLLPRAVIEDVRRRVLEMAEAHGSHPRLAAKVVRIESVKVSLDSVSDPVAARRVHLTLAVESVPSKATERSRLLQREIDQLLLDAERIKSSAPERETAGA